MIKIEKRIIDSFSWTRKCPIQIDPQFITIHEMNTWQDAEDCAKYASKSLSPSAAHVYVDERRAIQIIPFNRCALACGDRNGPGNRKSVSIEICRTEAPGDLYYQAWNNAVQIVCCVQKELNIPHDHIVRHFDWTGANCPKRMMKEGLWEMFLRNVSVMKGDL